MQRARALDAFLHDVYGERAVVADGVVPAWVVDAAPGLRSVGAILQRQAVRAHVCGMDLVRDGAGGWHLLEDNVRVPSGLGYAMQNRRLSAAVLPDLPRPEGLLDVEGVAGDAPAALEAAALPAAPDTPARGRCSARARRSSAWFEHRMLGEEMGVPVAVSTEILVDDGVVYLLREGRRRRVDVLYLRIDEEALLHAAGADGRPLGPALRARRGRRPRRAGQRARQRRRRRQGGLRVRARADRVLPGRAAAAGRACRPTCAPTPTSGPTVLERLDQLVLKPVDGYGGEGVLIGPLATDAELAATRRQMLAAPAPLDRPGGGRAVHATRLRRRGASCRGTSTCAPSSSTAADRRSDGGARRADPGRARGQHGRQLLAGRRVEGHLVAGSEAHRGGAGA